LVDVIVTELAVVVVGTAEDRLATGRERAVAVIELPTIVAVVFSMAEQPEMFPFASNFVTWPTTPPGVPATKPPSLVCRTVSNSRF